MKLEFIEKKHETNNIWSYKFMPEQGVDWLAGQSIRIELPRKTWGYNERRFTITSLPSDKYLQITTRVGDSEFKKDLSLLEVGNIVDAYNIEGRLNWGDANRTKVFLAGGTGINLFYIALKQVSFDKLPIKVKLFYSSRDNPALFSDFFKQQESLGNIQLTLSNKRFEVDYLIKQLQESGDYDLHISGPDSMVFETKKALASAGIDRNILDSKFLI